MMIRQTHHSDLAIPPGEFLEEVIADLGMNKDELARRMNRPPAKLSAIFRGDKTITPDTALQLEKVVGVPAHVWTGLESEYRLTLARQQQKAEEQRLKDEQHYVAKFCYQELLRFGYVAKKTILTEKVLELHRFFGVTSLKTVASLSRYQPAFRIWEKKRSDCSPEATAAWLRVGEIEAHKIDCDSFNKTALKTQMTEIRTFTQDEPERFVETLTERLASAGVVLVILPHLPKTYAHGATFWLGKQKAVALLTIRGSWADIFWFSLFHELGHLLLHGKQVVFLENENVDDNEMEKEANDFAGHVLIPENAYREFVRVGSFYAKDIVRFADEVYIHPGIVVGRLQHDKYIDPSWHNKLRVRLRWKK